MSKFLLAALFSNERRVDVSKFRVENTFQTLVNILCSVAVLTKPMIKVNNENDGALA